MCSSALRPKSRAGYPAVGFALGFRNGFALVSIWFHTAQVMCFPLLLRSSAAHAYVDLAMRWRAAETLFFFAFLRLEDLGRSSEAG